MVDGFRLGLADTAHVISADLENYFLIVMGPQCLVLCSCYKRFRFNP